MNGFNCVICCVLYVDYSAATGGSVAKPFCRNAPEWVLVSIIPRYSWHL